jgi:hypothetical protein
VLDSPPGLEEGMGLDAGLDTVFDAVPDNVLELAAAQRIKCDCAPPAFAGSAPEQAPSVAMLATNLCLLQVEHIKSGTARDFFGLDLSMQRGNSFEAKRHVGKLACRKIASLLDEE